MYVTVEFLQSHSPVRLEYFHDLRSRCGCGV